MRRVVGPEMGVKASGGIRTLDDLRNMTAAGATPHRRQRQRQDRRGGGRLTKNPQTMQAARKAAVRFRERSELLDFLLEVAAATSETLDLDQLLANVADIVKEVHRLRAARDPAVQRDGAATCASATPSGIARRSSQPVADARAKESSGAAAATREPVLVGDVRERSRAT